MVRLLLGVINKVLGESSLAVLLLELRSNGRHLILKGAPLAGEELVLLPEPSDHLGPDEPFEFRLDSCDKRRKIVVPQPMAICIETDQNPMNDGAAGLRVIRLLEAAGQSLKLRGETVLV